MIPFHREEASAMMKSIQFSNYRGFKNYRLEGLSRVNLLVGKNNCGKTSLLEGIHFLASGGDGMVLSNTAMHRGEIIHAGESGGKLPDISHFFSGHNIRNDAEFSISCDNGLASVGVKIIPLENSGLIDPYRITELHRLPPAYGMRIEGSKSKELTFVVSEEGALLSVSAGLGVLPKSERKSPSPVQLIGPDVVASETLAEMWGVIIDERREKDIVRAMQILETDIEDIVFRPRPSKGREGVVVSLKGQQNRLPLGTLGDGMYRLLGLANSLDSTRDGTLLIDEIDTGLHYSVMTDMWKLVVQTAMDLNIQVFATTHSLDCVHGLAELCEINTPYGEQVSVQKIEPSLKHSVSFNGNEIIIAAEQHIEVR